MKCDCVTYSAVGHTEISQLIVPVLQQLLRSSTSCFKVWREVVKLNINETVFYLSAMQK